MTRVGHVSRVNAPRPRHLERSVAEAEAAGLPYLRVQALRAMVVCGVRAKLAPNQLDWPVRVVVDDATLFNSGTRVPLTTAEDATVVLDLLGPGTAALTLFWDLGAEGEQAAERLGDALRQLVGSTEQITRLMRARDGSLPLDVAALMGTSAL